MAPDRRGLSAARERLTSGDAGGSRSPSVRSLISGPVYSLVPNTVWSDQEDEDVYVEEEKREETFYDKWRKGKWVITPEGNVYLDLWDVIIICALMTTAVAVPFEVALYEKTPQVLDDINNYLNYLFAIDIVLTFNVAMYQSNPMAKDTFLRDPLQIAQYYTSWPLSDSLKAGWFWPDLVTVIPWEQVNQMYQSAIAQGKDGRKAHVGVQVRLVRILRLVRMFRLVRVIKLVKRWHTSSGLSFAVVDIAKCFTCTILCVHWLSCGWAALGVNFSNSWLTDHAEDRGMVVSDFSRAAVYNMSLYFITMIITTVGLGDFLPVSQMEMALATLTMFITGVLWAWVLASIVNVITNSDAFATRFSQLSDDLNKLIELRNCSPNLKFRLRKFLDEAEHVYRQQYQRESISWLSMGLQGELAMESGVGEICAAVWYLQNLREHVLIEIAQHFTAKMFCPGEHINDMFSLCVLIKGSCFHKGFVIIPFKVVAEDVILSNINLRESAFPKTITFVEVMKLDREDLMGICERHPEFNHRIRRAQIRLAMWRGFIHAARVKKAEQGHDMTSTKSSAFERSHQNDNDRSMKRISGVYSMNLMRANTNCDMSGGGAPSNSGGGDVAAELRRLGDRFDVGINDIRKRIERLDGRVSQIEERTSRSKSCRAM